MKLRLLSDLHAEGGYDRNLLKSQGEDVLVIAGDLHVGADNVWHMLKQFAEHQPNVIFVAGNHEFYHHNYIDTVRKLHQWSDGTSIKFLNADTVYYNPSYFSGGGCLSNLSTLESIAFIGAPLWTNFRGDELAKFHSKSGINDFRLIRTYGEYFENRLFTPEDAEELFNYQYGYIKHQYETVPNKKVIVTHFLPADECVDPKYRGPATALLNSYFANDLGGWISELEDVPLFLHGHTHDNVDIMIGNTRVVANPYGYGKNYNYKECLIDL